MKKLLSLLTCLLMVFLLNACSVYNAAVDERNVKTISSDTVIKATILKRMIDDKQVKALDIKASSYYGHAYLIGTYEKESQRKRAIKIAKGVEGVSGLTTYLVPEKKLKSCGFKKNLSITANLKKRLVGDKNIHSTNIDYKSIQCTVVLWGYVGSKEEAGLAIKHAEKTKGVKKVKSFLRYAK